MNRDEMVKVLEAQPFETDVQVNIGGFLIDIHRVTFDEQRHSIIVELFADDADDALRHFLAGCPPVHPKPTWEGNTY